MSSAVGAILVRVLYLFGLLVIVIPISSVVTVFYVLLEPLQSCQLFSNSMQYLFRNFVQWPLRVAKRIVSPHQCGSQSGAGGSASRGGPTVYSASSNNANNSNTVVGTTANHSAQTSSSSSPSSQPPLPPYSAVNDSSLTTVHVVRG